MAANLAGRISSVFAGASRAAAASAAATADSIVHVNCTLNNIHVTVSNLEGHVVSRCSGGMIGFKHRQRANPLAAKDIAQKAVSAATQAGYRVAHIEMKGPSRGRSQVLRGILGAGMRVVDIRDVTPIPTSGCRPKSARRL